LLFDQFNNPFSDLKTLGLIVIKPYQRFLPSVAAFNQQVLCHQMSYILTRRKSKVNIFLIFIGFSCMPSTFHSEINRHFLDRIGHIPHVLRGECRAHHDAHQFPGQLRGVGQPAAVIRLPLVPGLFERRFAAAKTTVLGEDRLLVQRCRVAPRAGIPSAVSASTKALASALITLRSMRRIYL
jgi:hypothetical protein